jgi:hypothetical protein
VLSALEALSCIDPEAAAADLLAACPETEGVKEVLDGWLERREGSSRSTGASGLPAG